VLKLSVSGRGASQSSWEWESPVRGGVVAVAGGAASFQGALFGAGAPSASTTANTDVGWKPM
jgi:hypothetical protein